MKLSDFVASFLFEYGVRTVFGYQGSSISHLIDSITRSKIRYIQNHHEQASSFCANAYSEISESLGVTLACSGPGATNLVTGIANAFFDSLPCLFITGQVSTFEIKQDKKVRQNGFQETDIISIVEPITKYACRVDDPEMIRYYLEKAVFTMRDERPGPVLIDLPHNIQQSDIDKEKLVSFFNSHEHNQSNRFPADEGVGHATSLICESKKPLLLIGGGAAELRESRVFRDFVEILDLPVVSSLRGLDILEHDHPNFIGFIGSYGNRYANLAVTACDLLLVLGSRLDLRQTGPTSMFAPNAKIIHVDVDSSELNRVLPEAVSVHSHSIQFIERLLKIFEGKQLEHKVWKQKLIKLKKRFASTKEIKSLIGIKTNN